MILILLLSLFSAVQASALQAPLKIGDYILFGKYYDAPILWRVAELDEKGDPMLISDRIIAIRPYDAKGGIRQNSAWPPAIIHDRGQYGSNYWPDANIRQWLNSFEQKVEWVKSPPSKENTLLSNNPYDQEKGFIADGNFTGYERGLILVVEHKALLSAVDKSLKQGGTQIHAGSGNMDQVMQNYDDAYYQLVKDGVFLPDVKEIYDLYLNESTLGKDYYRAKPTREAIDHNTYKNSGLNVDQYWSYRLRTPSAGDGEKVGLVAADGKIDFDSGYGFDGTIGIRPALWLNYASVQFTGNGSMTDPYAIKGSRQATEENNKVLLMSSGGILIVFLLISTRGSKFRRKRKKLGRFF